MTETAVSLDALQQEFAEGLSAERAGFWRAAKAAALGLAQAKSHAERAKVRNALASVGHCTSNFVGQLEALFLAYPVEYQYPDVSLAMFRAVLQAAKRTGQAAHVLLDECLEAGKHVQDVSQLGRSVKSRVVTLSADCGDCGYTVTVKARGKQAGKLVGLPVRCPVCAALDDGRSGYAAPTLGQLQAVTGESA